eukprot:5543653-Pleurochrysis_carterae.AAC.1
MVTGENVEANTAALEVAAEAIAAVSNAADESAGAPVATTGVAVETTVAAFSAAEENTDAANTALD